MEETGYRHRPVGLESPINLQRVSLKKGHSATRHQDGICSQVQSAQALLTSAEPCRTGHSAGMGAGMEVCKRPVLCVPSHQS